MSSNTNHKSFSFIRVFVVLIIILVPLCLWLLRYIASGKVTYPDIQEELRIVDEASVKLGLPLDGKVPNAETSIAGQATHYNTTIFIYGKPKLDPDERVRVLSVLRQIRPTATKPIVVRFMRMKPRILLAEDKIE